MRHEIKYNTEQEELKISEYGRNIQEYVQLICGMEEKEVRTKLTNGLVSIISFMNPTLKQQEGYEQIIWDHLHIISDLKLDVDCPYPIPQLEEVYSKPDPLGYDTNRIRFRFYGRNLQLMVEKAASMKEGEDRESFINIIASFMFNSSRNWNDENLSKDVITDHILTLSKGKLKLDPESLNITIEAIHRKNYSNNKSNHNNKGRTSKNYRSNNNNRGVRR